MVVIPLHNCIDGVGVFINTHSQTEYFGTILGHYIHLVMNKSQLNICTSKSLRKYLSKVLLAKNWDM